MYFDYDDKPYYEHDKSLYHLKDKLSLVSKTIMNSSNNRNNKTKSCTISGGSRKNKTRKKYN